jgi:hypothetical protein
MVPKHAIPHPQAQQDSQEQAPVESHDYQHDQIAACEIEHVKQREHQSGPVANGPECIALSTRDLSRIRAAKEVGCHPRKPKFVQILPVRALH